MFNLSPEALDLSLAIYLALVCAATTRWFVNLAVQTVSMTLYARRMEKRQREERGR